MTFKKIQGELKEWELVVYIENFQKSMSIFLNGQFNDFI